MSGWAGGGFHTPAARIASVSAADTVTPSSQTTAGASAASRLVGSISIAPLTSVYGVSESCGATSYSFGAIACAGGSAA